MTQHDAAIRNVVSFAHEVRVHLRNSLVIVGNVVLATDPAGKVFQIRPWGLRSTMTVRFDEVVRVTPVRRMSWALQRSISAAQVAGVFATPAPASAAVGARRMAGEPPSR
jgi:hypothetical protein